MVIRGHVQNGVIVLDGGVLLPEGREVTVVAPSPGAAEPSARVPVTEERRQALLQLIGVWKVENPPSDEEAEEIIFQERMKKYG